MYIKEIEGKQHLNMSFKNDINFYIENILQKPSKKNKNKSTARPSPGSMRNKMRNREIREVMFLSNLPLHLLLKPLSLDSPLLQELEKHHTILKITELSLQC